MVCNVILWHNGVEWKYSFKYSTTASKNSSVIKSLFHNNKTKNYLTHDTLCSFLKRKQKWNKSNKFNHLTNSTQLYFKTRVNFIISLHLSVYFKEKPGLLVNTINMNYNLAITLYYNFTQAWLREISFRYDTTWILLGKLIHILKR